MHTEPYKEALGVLYRDILLYGANGFIKNAKISFTDTNGHKYTYTLKTTKNHLQTERLTVI